MNVGQWLQQDGMHRAEYGRVRADSDGERGYRDKREGRLLGEKAEGEANVLKKGIEKGQSPLLSVVFFGLLDTPEFASCGLGRLLRIHASAQIFFREELQVGAQLDVEILVKAPLAEQIQQ